MNTDFREGHLEVPGASLFYKLRGSGPVLLVLQGGAGDADGSDALAEKLANNYTVVSYDRRGLSRSPVAGGAEPVALDPHRSAIETHGDDVHRLLSLLGEQPALVFGSSLGALIGLDLVATHPEQVDLLVAHEPPVPFLLDDPERSQLEQAQGEVDQTFQREGLVPALKKLLALSGGGYAGDPEPEVTMAGPTPNQIAQHNLNFGYFLANDAPAAHRYQPDLKALEASSTKIIPAAGRLSAKLLPHRCAEALAAKLGRPLAIFPGGHTGYVLRPRAFATVLQRTLAEEAAKSIGT